MPDLDVAELTRSLEKTTGYLDKFIAADNAGHDESGGGHQVVELPGDDLSFGPNEGGPAGKFFFTPDGVYVFWDGPILYMDAPLDVLQQPAVVKYNEGSKPSNTAPRV